MRVANGTRNEHASVLRLIRDNIADFTEFGGVGFEIQPFDTAGGVQRREVAILNEEHATLLLTYMRNNDVVKDFKKRLVREFSALRRAAVGQTREERLALAVVEAQAMLAEKDERIAELAPKAEFYDELMDADGCFSWAQVANMLGWGRNVMCRELRRLGVVQGNLLPYQRYAHHFKVVPGTYTNKAGETIPTATTKVLPAGIDFLRRKLARSLELAEVDS
ncbi:hypothetical protein B1R94_02075 [Mycolicibacterium litorale]|nr:hypothetical protein B1R94_02075 [Mycolicibacterium litorale]